MMMMMMMIYKPPCLFHKRCCIVYILQQHSEMSKAPGKPTDPSLHFTKFTPGEKYFVRQLIINPNKEVCVQIGKHFLKIRDISEWTRLMPATVRLRRWFSWLLPRKLAYSNNHLRAHQRFELIQE